MPKYEQQADFDAASGADEVERERRQRKPFCHHTEAAAPRITAQRDAKQCVVVRRMGPALSERMHGLAGFSLSAEAMHELAAEVAALEAQLREARPAPLRPLEEWHEDYGCVLWWKLPVDEPPWVGSPLNDDWVEDYYTHWQEIPCPTEPGE